MRLKYCDGCGKLKPGSTIGIPEGWLEIYFMEETTLDKKIVCDSCTDSLPEDSLIRKALES